MNKETEERLGKIVDEFRWRTNDGDVLKISDMETSHVFNTLKMWYNHFAEAQDLPSFWFNHSYNGISHVVNQKPDEVLGLIAVFIWTIETRGDLPEKYVEPYQNILKVLKMLHDKKCQRYLKIIKEIGKD